MKHDDWYASISIIIGIALIAWGIYGVITGRVLGGIRGVAVREITGRPARILGGVYFALGIVALISGITNHPEAMIFWGGAFIIANITFLILTIWD